MGLRSKIIKTILGLSLIGSLSFGLYRLDQYDSAFKQEHARRVQEGRVPIVAEVVTESYVNNLIPVEKREGFFSYSNPTVTLDSRYTLKCRTESGHLFGLSVVNGGSVTKESLDSLIEPGSRISFPQGNFSDDGTYRYPNETSFRQDTQAGSKRADRIKVLGIK